MCSNFNTDNEEDDNDNGNSNHTVLKGMNFKI